MIIKRCLVLVADGHVRFGIGKVKQSPSIVSFTGSLHTSYRSLMLTT